MEYVNTTQNVLFLNLDTVLSDSTPNFVNIWQIKSVKSIKIDELWNGVNVLLSAVFGLLSSRNFATMATWRNDFSSLLISPTFYSFQFPFASLVNSEQSLTLKICLPN